MTQAAVAILGGTGPLGRGLGYRFARAGRTVVLGSRDASRAQEVAAEVAARLPGRADAEHVTGAANAAAAREADIVVLAVPFDGLADVIAPLSDVLADRIVVSTINPLGFDDHGPYPLEPPDGSAAQTTQRLVPTARVVAAFHHVAARSLWSERAELDDEDVLVCGDDADATGVVAELAATVTGRPGIEVGPLRLSRQLEGMTAVLLAVNRRYRVRAGLRIAGLGTNGG